MKLSSRVRWILSSLYPIVLAVVLGFAVLTPVPAHAQKDSLARRKVLNHPPAPYPTLARTMGLTGVVRVDAVVAIDGTVKTLDVKGGHPVLAQAAASTIRQWKWEPASRESHEIIEIRFSPSE